MDDGAYAEHEIRDKKNPKKKLEYFFITLV